MRGGTSQDGEGAGGTLTRDQGARRPLQHAPPHQEAGRSYCWTECPKMRNHFRRWKRETQHNGNIIAFFPGLGL